MKKKTAAIIAAAAAAYILLLVLLVIAEHTNADANINSFIDAFWYSLATITTVGYGDYYPVSAAGRVIGICFMLLSLGAFAAVIYSLASVIKSRFMPFLRIQLNHGRDCCIFSEYNEASAALARDMKKNDPGRRMIFCGTDEDKISFGQSRDKEAIFLAKNAADTVLAAAGGKRQYAGKLSVFLMSDDISQNFALAKELEGIPVRKYCRGTEIPKASELEFFDPDELCARQYWQENPISAEETSVMIVGSGKLAGAILGQALLMNCREPFYTSVYHVFGSWNEYRGFHPSLETAVCVNGTAKDKDAVIFHQEDWNSDRELTETAGRIIFCDDDRTVNTQRAADTVRYFALSGEVHAAAEGNYPAWKTFGAAETIYTEELAVKNALDRRARQLHESYCRLSGGNTGWDELPLFLKNSNRAAADHLLTKIRLMLPEEPPLSVGRDSCEKAYKRWLAADKDPCRKNEHERWLRFHCLYNWKYGPEKDSVRRTHPCITDYESLSESDKEKDDSAWEEIGRLCEELTAAADK